jgi:hypothetical protein
VHGRPLFCDIPSGGCDLRCYSKPIGNVVMTSPKHRGGVVAISTRSNRALAGFWAGVLCVTILGVGVLEFAGAARQGVEKLAETDAARSAPIPTPPETASPTLVRADISQPSVTPDRDKTAPSPLIMKAAPSDPVRHESAAQIAEPPAPAASEFVRSTAMSAPSFGRKQWRNTRLARQVHRPSTSVTRYSPRLFGHGVFRPDHSQSESVNFYFLRGSAWSL